MPYDDERSRPPRAFATRSWTVAPRQHNESTTSHGRNPLPRGPGQSHRAGPWGRTPRQHNERAEFALSANTIHPHRARGRTTRQGLEATPRQHQAHHFPRTQPTPTGSGAEPPGGTLGSHPKTTQRASRVRAFREHDSPTSKWPGAGSNRRPTAFQAVAHTN
jgi:hypothetical protein